MRIAICDDDERELCHLTDLLIDYQSDCRKSIDCRKYCNGTDFLCEMQGGEYDLILLDVLMPGLDGIQVAREVRQRDQNVKIILLSAAPEFAVESYSVGAYHYLLKPTDPDLLFQLLDKAESELAVQDEQGFLLRNREGVVRIDFTKLEYVEVINKTVFCHLTDGVIHETNGTLTDFEEKLLNRTDFIKTHRSYLVNLGCIQAMDANSVVTKNGHCVPISRLRHKQVRDTYMRFCHQTGTAVCVPGTYNAVEMADKGINQEGVWRILLVDDDPAERAFWTAILQGHGCVVQTAQSGREALQMMGEKSYDCVLLDVMISDEDGFSVCEKMHKLADVPIIFLSCLTEADSQVKGFAAGGIDYITKDTPAELFWAKVETRMKLAGAERTQLSFGPLLLDLTRRRVLMQEKELDLTPVEFDILWYLSGQTDHVYTPKEIFDRIWGGQPWDGGQTVQTHMSRLRRKLEKAGDGHHFIESVWGQGYRFVPVSR